MKKTLWIVIAVMIVAALIAVRTLRVHEREHAPLVEAVTVAVETATVRAGEVARNRHVLGTVIGAEETSLAPRVMAQVLEIKVREGDRVARGELLVRLDDREFEDAVAQGKAGVQAAKVARAAAEIEYDAQQDATARDKRLFEAKAFSQEQWDRSRAAEAASAAHLEAARAQAEVAANRLDQARTRLGYCQLTAPVSGVVSRRTSDPGDLGVPGKPLLEIVRQNNIRVRASLPPEDIADLQIGSPVTVTLGEHTVHAKVSRIFPSMDQSHLATMETDLSSPPPGFVSRAAVGVNIRLSSATGLTVPAGSLLEGEKDTWVFRVVDSTVHPVTVTIVDRSSDTVVVTGALQQGDTVIVARPSRLMTLADGVRVKIANRES
ncbi:MAG TPA: efflux RND transporter periplasmic adaptor subunit [Thermoanaerobaculia bacterium]|nr:efflux RND transporter periplasmic adaptor subunit [Thermoanaerobaculia bacterium]HUM28604.1 efflux RND transporter periplasmic adaptor subunit [Thermoanaerobaculia bacterium]HXK66788.1 efflux RND transporter periplasmic adaptor subunit [Thermoanaerobaculia bacterium]